MPVIFYIDCFLPSEKVSLGLLRDLNAWYPSDQPYQVRPSDAAMATDLRRHLDNFLNDHGEGDILIIGGHGHPSLSGFWVADDPLRWMDVSLLLRGKMKPNTEFVFYSCDGGFPGIGHLLHGPGPSFVWGPRIKVRPEAMRHATRLILDAHLSGDATTQSKIALVDQAHAWARARYPQSSYDHEFLRVIWSEGEHGRYPNTPSPDHPEGDQIPLRNWRR